MDRARSTAGNVKRLLPPRQSRGVSHWELVGIAGLFMAIGGVAVHAANGGTRAASATRRIVSLIHGLGALLILVGGFGMLARLGFLHGANLPAWLWVKVVLWFLLRQR